MSSKHEGRLLIIEDDNELNSMLSTYFEMQGYEVFNAFTGTEGVDLARRKLPHLILLDVMLPDMDGFDVCKSLRTATRTRYIPITFLTQRDGRSDKVAGLQLGADDYITKPFDLEELRLRVRRSIERSTREALIDPRTGLPGRSLVAERLAEIRDSDDDWKYLTGQIENLESFSEVYGFVATDEVMRFAARTFIEAIEKHGTQHDFVGHLGKAKFVVITHQEDIDAFMSILRDQFENGVGMFYSFAEREQGYISFQDEAGDMQQVPLMRLCLEASALPES